MHIDDIVFGREFEKLNPDKGHAFYTPWEDFICSGHFSEIYVKYLEHELLKFRKPKE